MIITKSTNLFLGLLLAFLIQSCTLVHKIAGIDVDQQQFDAARSAKILEVKMQAADRLIKDFDEIDEMLDSDLIIYIHSDIFNQILNQYEGRSSWLDKNTSYKIVRADIELNNGTALAKFDLICNYVPADITVKLTADCIIDFINRDTSLFFRFEPFNITPVADAGFLSLTESTIENIIKINLANLSDNLDMIKLPLELNNKMIIDKSDIAVRDIVNLDLHLPQRVIDYKLKIRKFLVLRERLMVVINLDKMEVRQK